MKKVFTVIFYALISSGIFAQTFYKISTPAQVFGFWKTTITLPPESAEEMLGGGIENFVCNTQVSLNLYLTIEKTNVKGITAITNSTEITFNLSSDTEFSTEIIETFEKRYKKKLYQIFEISADKKSIKIKTRKMSEKFKYTDKEFFASPVYISSDKKFMKIDLSGEGSGYLEFTRGQ